MSAEAVEKIVIIVAEDTPAPIAANACALLSLTIGARHPEIIGIDVLDQDGRNHAGLSGLVVPVLKADDETLARLAQADVEVIDFTETAARAKNYDDYTDAMAQTPTAELRYLAIALLGGRKAINSLTGSLPLMR